MLEYLFEVEDREKLDFLATNYLPKKDGTSSYTTLCDEQGGCLDDLIIYRWNEKKYWVIGNASNREKDLKQLDAKFLSDRFGIIAVQGPHSAKKLGVEFHKNCFVQKGDLVISATGYTGEEGFECIGPFDQLKELYLDLLNNGATPCGLGARDSLRLEMGYALYGHEIDAEISPLESVSKWAVKLDKDFFGKENCISRGLRHAYGIKLIEKGVPRQYYPIFQNNQTIGIVTSGTFSPSLQEGIALILVNQELKIGDQVQVGIRENKVLAVVTTLPFYRKDQ